MTGSELLDNRHRTVDRKHLNEQVRFGNNLPCKCKRGGVEISKYLCSISTLTKY